MTQEDKELLLKDLCARLPYGVKCNALLKQIDGSLKSIFGTFKGYNNGLATVGNNLVDIETVKPYLRPIHSMTEEELYEYFSFVFKEYDGYLNDDTPDFTGNHYVYIEDVDIFIDWLNAHHFDFRNLIERGLALEAPEGMYNN